jgi:periplasmic protein TonB
MSDYQEKKPKSRTLDDIVFETRNRDYGCYDLRSTYRHRLLVSVIWAVSIFLVTTISIYLIAIYPWNKRFDQSDLVQLDSINYDHDMVTLLSQLSEIEPDQTTPPLISLEPIPISTELKGAELRREVPIIDIKPIIPRADTSNSRLVDDLIRKHESQTARTKTAVTDSITMILDKVPQYPGGYAAVQTYFYKNQHYPENALIHGIHGSAVVSFIVNQNGEVEKAKVVKAVDPDLDQEAIRLVKAMPKWQPAYYKGKPIASMMIMPVDFSLR